MPRITRLYSGGHEVKLTTPTELLLLAALKAVLFVKGDDPSTNDRVREVYLDRFAFNEAVNFQQYDVLVATDDNNGRDFVALKK